MHYYQHHIGDFIKATARLSDSQAMAYLRLLWNYYDKDGIVRHDLEQIAFEIGADTKTVDLIIKTYFKVEDGFIKQSRCDKEIEGYLKKSAGGKEGANKRWSNKDGDRLPNSIPNGLPNADAMPTQCDPNANQEPITNNQEPVLKTYEAKASLSKDSLSTKCPHKEILNLWKAKLPHLTQPRSWEGARQANLKSRWIQASKASDYSPEGYKTVEDGLRWWASFFDYIANDTKLPQGFETKDRTWKPDLLWVVNAANFQKIIDGKYSK